MSRSPLMLLPGLLLDERLYGAQIAALAERAEMRVMDLTGADSIAALAAAVLAEAPERFALCGLSMGGYVAFEIMRRAPGRSSGWRCSTPRRDPTAPRRGRAGAT